MIRFGSREKSNRSRTQWLRTLGALGVAGAIWFQGSPISAQEEAPTRVAPQRPATTQANPSLQGGSGADFTQLMDLIQSETSGLWLEDGLGEGTMSQFDSGIRVDPSGTLSQVSRTEQTGRLQA
ncbi:MAG: hypothetical protein KDA58_15930, partial [Planctomycetaceae bacterium]|nr:hypothetical protein [Planctomycetaceae bacterium]